MSSLTVVGSVASSDSSKWFTGNNGLFNKIPSRLALNIVQWLPSRDLLRFSEVNRAFSYLSENESLWKGLLEKEFSSLDTSKIQPSQKIYREISLFPKHCFTGIYKTRFSCTGLTQDWRGLTQNGEIAFGIKGKQLVLFDIEKNEPIIVPCEEKSLYRILYVKEVSENRLVVGYMGRGISHPYLKILDIKKREFVFPFKTSNEKCHARDIHGLRHEKIAVSKEKSFEVFDLITSASMGSFSHDEGDLVFIHETARGSILTLSTTGHVGVWSLGHPTPVQTFSIEREPGFLETEEGWIVCVKKDGLKNTILVLDPNQAFSIAREIPIAPAFCEKKANFNEIAKGKIAFAAQTEANKKHSSGWVINIHSGEVDERDIPLPLDSNEYLLDPFKRVCLSENPEAMELRKFKKGDSQVAQISSLTLCSGRRFVSPARLVELRAKDGPVVFDFGISEKTALLEIAEKFKTGPACFCAQGQRFLSLPLDTRNSIYARMAKIIESQLGYGYLGCGEDAFEDKGRMQGQATHLDRAQAILDHLKTTPN